MKQINARPLNRTHLKAPRGAAVMIHTAKAAPVAILTASVVVVGVVTQDLGITNALTVKVV